MVSHKWDGKIREFLRYLPKLPPLWRSLKNTSLHTASC